MPVSFILQLGDTGQEIAIRNALVGLASGCIAAWQAKKTKSKLGMFFLGLLAHIAFSFSIIALFFTGGFQSSDGFGFAIYFAMFEILIWVFVYLYVFVISYTGFSTFFREEP